MLLLGTALVRRILLLVAVVAVLPLLPLVMPVNGLRVGVTMLVPFPTNLIWLVLLLVLLLLPTVGLMVVFVLVPFEGAPPMPKKLKMDPPIV